MVNFIITHSLTLLNSSYCNVMVTLGDNVKILVSGKMEVIGLQNEHTIGYARNFLTGVYRSCVIAEFMNIIRMSSHEFPTSPVGAGNSASSPRAEGLKE